MKESLFWLFVQSPKDSLSKAGLWEAKEVRAGIFLSLTLGAACFLHMDTKPLDWKGDNTEFSMFAFALPNPSLLFS